MMLTQDSWIQFVTPGQHFRCSSLLCVPWKCNSKGLRVPVQTHTLKSRGVKNVKPTAEALLSRRHSEYRASTLAAPSDHAGREQLQPEVSLPPRRTPTLPARLRQVGCLSTQRRRWRLRRARCLVDRNFSVRFFPIGNSGHSRQVITLLCLLNLWQENGGDVINLVPAEFRFQEGRRTTAQKL